MGGALFEFGRFVALLVAAVTEMASAVQCVRLCWGPQPASHLRATSRWAPFLAVAVIAGAVFAAIGGSYGGVVEHGAVAIFGATNLAVLVLSSIGITRARRQMARRRHSSR